MFNIYRILFLALKNFQIAKITTPKIPITQQNSLSHRDWGGIPFTS